MICWCWRGWLGWFFCLVLLLGLGLWLCYFFCCSGSGCFGNVCCYGLFVMVLYFCGFVWLVVGWWWWCYFVLCWCFWRCCWWFIWFSWICCGCGLLGWLLVLLYWWWCVCYFIVIVLVYRYWWLGNCWWWWWLGLCWWLFGFVCGVWLLVFGLIWLCRFVCVCYGWIVLVWECWCSCWWCDLLFWSVFWM